MSSVIPSSMRFAMMSMLTWTHVGAVNFTGYVVDNYCWNQPNHRGIDGSQLGTAPGTHILHCLWQVQACKDQGYAMLEPLSSPAADGSTFGIKYQLDSVGNNLVFQLLQAEQARGGDRAFDEQVTVTGTVSGTSMAASMICVTPAQSNPSGATFCRTSTSAGSSTSSASWRTSIPPFIALLVCFVFYHA